LLIAADAQAAKQKNDTTGLREIAARLSSRLSSGGFGASVEVDASERPKKVRFLSAVEQKEHEAQEVEEDLAPLRRIDIIKRDSEQLSVAEQYRVVSPSREALKNLHMSFIRYNVHTNIHSVYVELILRKLYKTKLYTQSLFRVHGFYYIL